MLGFSGITNEPFAGLYGVEFARQLEAAGIGFSREVELIRTAHRMDVFTVAWVFNEAEASIMAEAGADVIGAIVGVTGGGLTGTKQVMSLEKATAEVQKMCQAARSVNPKVFVLTHGGPFADVETAQYSIVNSDADGYASGSSGGRGANRKRGHRDYPAIQKHVYISCLTDHCREMPNPHRGVLVDRYSISDRSGQKTELNQAKGSTYMSTVQAKGGPKGLPSGPPLFHLVPTW